jgi:hypothetical protein
MTLTVFVTEADGREDTHHCLDDGVLNPPNGSLVLIYDRNASGHIREGFIYAPGEWKRINITPYDE